MITVPYLVRTLGVSNFGIYSFSLAFMSYFQVITNYGFNLTATRDISVNRNNKENIEGIVSTVYLTKLFLTLFCFLILILMITFVPKFNQYSLSYLVSFLLVIGNVLFPGWFFQGIEKMKYITLLSITGRILLTISVFVFVKQEKDYIIALLINSMSYLIPGILGITLIKVKYQIKFKLVSFKKIFKALSDGWYIFISSLLGNIISSSGTFVLGLTSSNSVVGIYSSIIKIIKAVIGLFLPITQSLFPYVSAKFSQNYEVGISIVKKAGKIIMAISFFIGTSLFILAPLILEILYGIEIAKYSLVMRILVIWLLFSVLNNIIGYQYLIASGQEKLYSRSFIKAGIVTILLYIILSIPFSMYGIIIAMLAGEISLTFLMIISMHKNVTLK